MADDTATQDSTSTETPAPEAPATGETTPGNEWQDKFEGQRKVNRDLERKLREAEKVAEQARLATLSEAEKAIELARTETRTTVLREVGARMVDAEVRAAAAGRLPAEQIDALLEGLDRSRFITDDGDVDRSALTAWVDRIAPSTPSNGQHPRGDVDQGARAQSLPVSDEMEQKLRALLGG